MPPRLRAATLAGVFIGALLAGCGPSSPDRVAPASVLDSLPTAPASPAEPGLPTRLVRGQTLYVPAYSHIYVRDAKQTMNLATTLNIRNTSPEASLSLSTIEYYDSNGRRVREYVDTTRTLGPLASTYVVVEQDDVRGGVGANFLVRWHASRPIHPPVVETVMITSEATQGISFRSTARVLYEETEAATGPSAPPEP
jgi:hypothetical protein